MNSDARKELLLYIPLEGLHNLLDAGADRGNKSLLAKITAVAERERERRPE
jgi:hypothetical protein